VESAAQQQEAAPKKRVPGRPFAPGQSGNPKGRKRKTDEVRQLEKLTRAEVQDRLDAMLGPALARLLSLVEKADAADALKSVLAVLDRTIGSVPSASYINAQFNGSAPPEKISAEQVNKALQQWQIAKGLLPAADVVENNSSG
jgi:hypothetical protein